MGSGEILLAAGGALFFIPSTVWTSDRLWIIVGPMSLPAALYSAAGIAPAGAVPPGARKRDPLPVEVAE